VNLYGGAGVGKSTLAALVFAELKMRGITADLVGEFAKELVYDRAYNVMADQHYLFAQQAHRLWRMKNYNVQVAVCDSPLLLSIAYNQETGSKSQALREQITNTYRDYDNMDFFLTRNDEFWKKDHRSGDINKAKNMDELINTVIKDTVGHDPIKLDPGGKDIAKKIADMVEAKAATIEWNHDRQRPLTEEPQPSISQ
jgi:nicotinamide riboside kinase